MYQVGFMSWMGHTGQQCFGLKTLEHAENPKPLPLSASTLLPPLGMLFLIPQLLLHSFWSRPCFVPAIILKMQIRQKMVTWKSL